MKQKNVWTISIINVWTSKESSKCLYFVLWYKRAFQGFQIFIFNSAAQDLPRDPHALACDPCDATRMLTPATRLALSALDLARDSQVVACDPRDATRVLTHATRMVPWAESAHVRNLLFKSCKARLTVPSVTEPQLSCVGLADLVWNCNFTFSGLIKLFDLNLSSQFCLLKVSTSWARASRNFHLSATHWPHLSVLRPTSGT